MRQDHAILDAESRNHKAEKVIRILERRKPLDGCSILEIGTGSGVLASAFSERVGSKGSVWAVDVKDQRIEKSGYNFKATESVILSFEDDAFDVVVSSHVIEHVGNRSDQMKHLSEILRVLRPSGLLYLAVPNRWRLVEPHYRVPFLSWIPKRIADRLVRAMRRNDEFDIELLSRNNLRSCLQDATFTWEEVDFEAINLVVEIEKQKIVATIMKYLPQWFLEKFFVIIPTLIVVARKSDAKVRHDESIISQP